VPPIGVFALVGNVAQNAEKTGFSRFGFLSLQPISGVCMAAGGATIKSIPHGYDTPRATTGVSIPASHRNRSGRPLYLPYALWLPEIETNTAVCSKLEHPRWVAPHEDADAGCRKIG